MCPVVLNNKHDNNADGVVSLMSGIYRPVVHNLILIDRFPINC